MRRLAPVAAAAAALALGAAGGARADGARLAFERYQLDNGLTVLLHQDHASPVVAVETWFRVGSKDERPGRTGFAHLFEHLMFTGSKHVANGEFDRRLEAAGANNNGSTSNDRTNYYETLPSNQLELAFWLDADRLATLDGAIDQKKLDIQRDVVRNERRQTYENRPYGRVELKIPELLFPPGHPYRWPVIGYHEDLLRASLADVLAFFREHYRPNNAVLVVAGDFDPARVKALVARYFGWIPRGPAPRRANPPPLPPLDAEQRLTLEDQVQLPRVYLEWRSPVEFREPDAELDLAARLLAGGKASRLYRALVFQQRLAQDVSASNDSQAAGGQFELVATAKPGVSPARLEAAIDAELAKLRAAAPSQDELERAKSGFESDLLRSLESVIARADLLARYEAQLGDPGYLDRDLARHRAVTAEGLRAAVDRWLPAHGRAVLHVVPAPPAAHPEPEGD